MSGAQNQGRGVFRARVTRDAQALDRDGEDFCAVNELGGADPRGGAIFEVMFADGVWMLATAADLDL